MYIYLIIRIMQGCDIEWDFCDMLHLVFFSLQF